MDDRSEKPKNLHQPLLITVAVTSVIACIVFALFWWQQKLTSSDLSRQVTRLEGIVKDIPAPAITTSYTATVGKFTLTLPNNYVIIRHLDAGGEGGPATHLSIGTKIKELPAIAEDHSYKHFGLTAVPAIAGDNFANWVKKIVESEGVPVKKLADLTIDGVAAEAYEFDGLAPTRKIFFQNNSIWYTFTLSFTSSDTQPPLTILDAVVEGFKFESVPDASS